MITCVAIVGKANSPLFVQSFPDGRPAEFQPSEPQLEYNYIVHTALDIIEEKGTPSMDPSAQVKSRRGPRGADMYLGMLYPTEDFKVYGYITSTKNKFVLVTTDDYSDNDIPLVFRKLHNLFANQVSNPFYVPDEPIVSKQFEKEIRSLVTAAKKFGTTK
eukprot:TRINITY_DN4688_c1_g1_i1.p1 TRINITY_DN4688_c1_g1~~TRINITY_DN4688_c1_g1_i1.p1  ORF type:complete len:160 (+),score=30.63 TRINITY_DN4688_c1_g1_i1:34-513(+)